MSFFVYDDEPKRKQSFGGIPKELDPNVYWEPHCENWFLLKFFYQTSKLATERIQAGKELDIAEKRMKFWEKHPEFDKKKSEEFLSVMRTRWVNKVVA